MDMMMAVMGRPPNRAPLNGRSPDHGENELHEPGRPKGFVREIAMVKPRNSEHSKGVESNGDNDGDRADTDPKYG
jgi:hypothetical protein